MLKNLEFSTFLRFAQSFTHSELCKWAIRDLLSAKKTIDDQDKLIYAENFRTKSIL